MSRASLLLDGPPRSTVCEFFEARAAAVDAGQAEVRAGIAFACNEVLGTPDGSGHPNADLLRVAETIATVAWSDLSSAFTLWCQRMVLEYLALAPVGSDLRDRVLPRVQCADLSGATALASGMAHAVSGAPLPVTARREGGRVVLSGRVPWASNLFPPRLLIITAAMDEERGQPIIVAMPGDADGVRIPPHQHLLALGSTGSASLTLDAVAVDPDWVITDDFAGFIGCVRPPFLLLQSSFAWGLARRALDETAPLLSGMAEILRPDYEALEERAADLAGGIRQATEQRGLSTPIPEIVRMRYECASLATKAVALESLATGGRGYTAGCGTARRVREAAFLPVQAPTEVQLRWELQRYASAAVPSTTA